jgi:tRNA pseudouridine55 synthase
MHERSKTGQRPIAGIVLIDKPEGITSNRALQQTKRLFRAVKAGHTGTLDPLATGMLPVCFGAATKVSGLMLSATKRYRVVARCGVATDTGDSTGREVDRRYIGEPSLDAVRDAAAEMLGWTEQVPPMYSALKYNGKRLYELARAGTEVPRAARRVQLLELEIENFAWPEFTMYVHCSKGTYIRSLIVDLAAKLGTVAHVRSLRRLSVSPYHESQMVRLEELEAAAARGTECLDEWLLGIDSALVDWPSVTVSQVDAALLRNGRRVDAGPAECDEPVRVYDSAGAFVGLGQFTDTGELKPSKIFPV